MSDIPIRRTTEEPSCQLQLRNGVLQQKWKITKWAPDRFCEDVWCFESEAWEWRDVPQVSE